jgi:hypothetical protein
MELFGFSNDYWISSFERYKGMILREEMDLYELLDFDADGEVDGETADIDDTTEVVLVD